MFILILLLVLAIFFTVLVVLKYIKAEKFIPERIIMLTGTMGSGKTLFGSIKLGVLRGIQKLTIFKRRFFHWKSRPKVVPLIYSNIPLKSKFYRPITSGMILRTEPMQQNCVIFLDEFGSFLNQYDWSNPVVIEQVTNFIRFCRHWLDAYIIITDQTSESIPKAVRDRLSTEYHLARCRKFLHFWRIVDVYKVQHITSDSSNVIEVTDKVPYFMFYFNPRRSIYDTRCYSETYYDGFVFNPDEDDSTGLKTRHLLDFEPSKEFCKQYKEDRRAAKRQILSTKLPRFPG